ncbi:MAG: hypothetical protein HZC36_03835 [Armatimonadetes bacterium]|nr:hypothetical protein [Armatimonadota bacterium]
MSSELRVTPKDDLEAVAFKVCTALDRRGITAVLCGGSAASIYAPEAYMSSDVDFIASFWGKEDVREEVLQELGYVSSGRIFVCDGQLVTLDFPNDELLIGDELLTDFKTIARDGLTLNVLTPFDCVRDRLSWDFFYQRRDPSARLAAAAVALAEAVDLERIRVWAESVGSLQRFEEFLGRVERLKRSTRP